MREIGLIDTARGVIRIKDPVRLAAVACECWPADVAMRTRLIEGAPGRRYRDDVDVPGLVKRYHALARARSGAGHLPG
ncbi:hypothetical protein [uncultured Phenylobacterium sp.]|uniref:hypothetical protein n=1 Tax=uncultured Phenylobacterium sp. TaxID=349273 RepID=UPI0025D5A337|nr:hypothetical protein [uncultured Phenylobacterium sp.]